MKKRIISALLMICMLLSNTVMAMSVDKLKGHWAEKKIEKDFMTKYFKELSENNFAKFNPNAPLPAKVFAKALEKLSNEYGDFKVNIFANSDYLTRESMIDYIFDGVKNIKFARNEEKAFDFTDIEKMDKIRKEKLKYLLNKGIVYGNKDKKYAPQKKLSQVEGVLVVQRIYEIFKDNEGEKSAKNLSFDVQNISEGLSNNGDSIYYKKVADQILITFTMAFPNPGYTVGVEKVLLKNNKNIIIYPQVVAPGPTTITLQVIAYKTVTLALNADETGDGPFDIKVIGNDTNANVEMNTR